MKSKLKNLVLKSRYGLLLQYLIDHLDHIGIMITPYYWIQEGEGYDIPLELSNRFKDYSFCFFGQSEMEVIATMGVLRPRHASEAYSNLNSRLERGSKCFGAKFKGKIVAFTWIDFKEGGHGLHRRSLNDQEAYLYGMYTSEEFRGKGIAPYLRYRCYEALKATGRNKFYSFSDFFNTPAIKFKKKLNAKFLELGIYVMLFKRYRWEWIIKK